MYGLQQAELLGFIQIWKPDLSGWCDRWGQQQYNKSQLAFLYRPRDSGLTQRDLNQGPKLQIKSNGKRKPVKLNTKTRLIWILRHETRSKETRQRIMTDRGRNWYFQVNYRGSHSKIISFYLYKSLAMAGMVYFSDENRALGVYNQ